MAEFVAFFALVALAAWVVIEIGYIKRIEASLAALAERLGGDADPITPVWPPDGLTWWLPPWAFYKLGGKTFINRVFSRNDTETATHRVAVEVTANGPVVTQWPATAPLRSLDVHPGPAWIRVVGELPSVETVKPAPDEVPVGYEGEAEMEDMTATQVLTEPPAKVSPMFSSTDTLEELNIGDTCWVDTGRFVRLGDAVAVYHLAPTFDAFGIAMATIMRTATGVRVISWPVTVLLTATVSETAFRSNVYLRVINPDIVRLN